MCDHGDTVDVEVSIPASHSHTGEERRAVKPIDRCIAPLVSALDKLGFLMAGSCCGHGKAEPQIVVIGQQKDKVILARPAPTIDEQDLADMFKPASEADEAWLKAELAKVDVA